MCKEIPVSSKGCIVAGQSRLTGVSRTSPTVKRTYQTTVAVSRNFFLTIYFTKQRLIRIVIQRDTLAGMWERNESW